MKRFSILFAVILPMLALFGLFSTFAIPSHALEVGGTISSDTTWTLANSPYTVTSNLTIDHGVTLTIEEGVEVVAQNGEYMDVYGHLVVAGSLASNTMLSGFSNIEIFNAGSANINHALIHSVGTPNEGQGIIIGGNSTNPISVTNSTIENARRPISVLSDSLHRLQMENVTFANNTNNRVYISINGIYNHFIEDVSLKPQPGLEAYMFVDDTAVYIPNGITMTLEAGATLMSEEHDGFSFVIIDGGLVTQGSITQSVIITGFSDLSFGGSGIGDLNHTLIHPHSDSYETNGISIHGGGNNIVEVNNSEIRNADHPIGISAESAHRLKMNNVNFAHNINNQVFIIFEDRDDDFTQDITLIPQPGLEGYVFDGDLSYPTIPEGITVTLEAGVTLMRKNHEVTPIMHIEGRLVTNGNISHSTIIMGFGLLEFGPLAEGDLNHTLVYIQSDWADASGISVARNSGNLVKLRNSEIQNAEQPIKTWADSIHRLQMGNVDFTNNVNRRVYIIANDDHNNLSESTRLTMQPGLEGYEVYDSQSSHPPLQIPEGVMLTMEAGASLLISNTERVEVNGRLQANGTEAHPVTFTSAQDAPLGNWDGLVVNGGDVDLLHTEISYGVSNLSILSPTSTATLSHTNIISASQSGVVVHDGQLSIDCSSVSNNSSSGLGYA